VIGPNGSGKTSLIEALLRLSTLSRLPVSNSLEHTQKIGGPELLREGSLGDKWFSGILGGVPEETS
jgi:ABC-type cobalamin/Fe3+-siderophores transport system ATPase subunit